MKVCFAGDVFLGGDLINISCTQVVEVSIFNKADKRIVNLEQPISDSSFIEDKCTLYTNSYALKQLLDLQIDAVNLAHNHIQDKGLDAIEETIEHLDSINIGHFGTGKNIFYSESPYWLTEEIAILGYCDFDKPYLKQVVVASESMPGVNPLRLEKIHSDLDNLPAGSKAILYFHWGMEHVWLPPFKDIQLAKKILQHERVLTIIGMHPHRVQGVITHAGKKAYMCLGNFIFPNFYMKPPTQIFYPSKDERKSVRYMSRQYLKVYETTYKKWRWVNRVSMVLEYCTDTNQINHKFVIQDDDQPKIKELKGLGLLFFKFWFSFMSLINSLPKRMYSLIWELHAIQVKVLWRLQIIIFQSRQLGITAFTKMVIVRTRKKFEK